MSWGTEPLVAFYRGFNSPYAYTSLGCIADAAEQAQAQRCAWCAWPSGRHSGHPSRVSV